MKDTKTILLILLSIGLVATWGFYLSEKTKNGGKKETVLLDNTNELKNLQDSLKFIYEGTLYRLGTQLDSVKSTADTLQGQLDARTLEILQLKSEITALLVKANPRKEDMSLAGKKTSRLQQLVSSLPSKSNTAISQNTSTITPEKTTSSFNESNEALEKNIKSPYFTVSNLKVGNTTSIEGDETSFSNNTGVSNISVSFSVQNNTSDFPNAEIFTVVTQPDGKVIQNAWESASMETRNGTKKYTRKVRFEYLKGETKQVQFNLSSDDNEKRNYTVQVYHNGYMIGQTKKMLN